MVYKTITIKIKSGSIIVDNSAVTCGKLLRNVASLTPELKYLRYVNEQPPCSGSIDYELESEEELEEIANKIKLYLGSLNIEYEIIIE